MVVRSAKMYGLEMMAQEVELELWELKIRETAQIEQFGDKVRKERLR